MIDSYERAFDALPRAATHDRSGGSFWRKEPPGIRQTMKDPEVTRGGMFPHQLKWWMMPQFIKGLVSGFGGGKSFTLYKRAIASAIENAPVPVIICMPTYPMAKMITIPTMDALLEGKRSIYGRAFDWDFNAQAPMRYRIRFRGRQAVIWVLSSDNPKTLVGATVAAVYMDEPFIQDYTAFEKLMSRIRHPGAITKEFCLAGTPEQLNWGYDLFKGELRDKFDSVGVGLVQASTRDNLALETGYADRLAAGYDSLTASAYLDGQFVNLAKGRIYFAFDETRNVVADEHLPRPTGAKLGLGIDFNVNPMAFVVFWYTDDHLHYLWEQEIPNADTDYACQIVREKFGDPGQLEDCFPDPACTQRNTAAPAGRTDAKILKARGFTLFHRRQHPTRRDRYNAANAGFRPALGGPPRITVSPKCKRLVYCLGEYTSKIMNTEAGKQMSHILDASTYAPEYLFGLQRPRVHSHRISVGA